MTKELLLDKLRKGNPDKGTIISWVECLPSHSIVKNKITHFKKGDVVFHPAFNHPVVLLKKYKGYFVGVSLTSDKDCSEVLRPCSSRFFMQSFFTKNLIVITNPEDYAFRGVYENGKELNEVYKNLKEIL